MKWIYQVCILAALMFGAGQVAAEVRPKAMDSPTVSASAQCHESLNTIAPRSIEVIANAGDVTPQYPSRGHNHRAIARIDSVQINYRECDQNRLTHPVLASLTPYA